MSLMTRWTSDTILKEAFTSLCRQRRDWLAHTDVWDLRRHWTREKARLRNALCEGTYQIGLLSRVTLADGTEMDLWSARDVLLLKVI